MIVATIIVVATQVFFDLTLPDKMGEIIRMIQNSYDVPITTGDIWLVGGEMMLIVLGSVACSIIAGYFAASIGAGFAKTLRRDVFVKVSQLSMEEMVKFSTSSLITRTTNDVVQVQQVTTMLLRIAVSAPITAVGAILKITDKSAQLSFVTAGAILAMFALMLFMFFVVMPKFSIMQKLTDKLNLVSRENLTGLRVVRAYNAESIEEIKFEKANDDITKTHLFVSRVSAIMSPGMQIIISALSLTLSWFGAYLISQGNVKFDDLAVFMQYSMQVLMSFMMLSMLFVMVPRATVSAKRINEVLSTKTKIVDGGYDQQTEQRGTIEFVDVNFKYPDAEDYVLKDITFSVKQGETVAFIGSTGSGKSTLINLVARLYDATSGKIIVDGIEIKDYNLKTLYDKIGYIPQKGMLFSGTIEQNIQYGKEGAANEEVLEAIKIAQASEFVNNLSEGTQYHIAQGGQNVSGGQKQRLSIARAIIKKPEIYIFDDSFSALDYRTDKALRAALKTELKGATSLIVAQRIGTILDADKIIVLEHGEIVDIGTHKELLERCTVYQEIAYSQLSKEELQ